MFTQYAVVLAFASVALGNLFVTEPVATTTWQAGTPQTVSWQDDGKAPDLAAFGPAKISIYVGSAQQQTLLQTITPSLDVSTAGSIQFTPDPAIGPNSNQYFIRFESIGLKDATTPTAPALSFSAKFTMSGMTGTFSPDVQAQINGASSAPLSGATTTTALVTTTPVTKPALTTSTPKPAAAPSSSSKPPATSSTGASAAKSTNSANTLFHSSVVAVVAAAAAIGVVLY